MINETDVIAQNTINRSVNKVLYNKHRNRKNNDIVAAMYAMYQTGKSLEKIARVYRKTRQAVYDVFKSRGYKLRSKEMRGLTVVDGHNFTVTKGGYLRGTVGGKRMLLHYYVWQKEHGPIEGDFVIHHKDNNPGNNLLSNLELVARCDMQKCFNPTGRNQFSK